MIVFFGPSQAGKTTTFNVVTGESRPVGDGSGESVTADAFVASSMLGKVVDTPGLQDSRLLTDEEAAETMAMAVVEAGVPLVKFVVFESLANDSMQVGNTLFKLAAVCGKGVLKSIVVALTKADMVSNHLLEGRKELRQRRCQEFGISEIVMWQNKAINEEGLTDQLLALQQKLARVPGTSMERIERLHEAVAHRAVELSAAAPPKKKTTEESYTEDVMVDQTYTENYVVYETRTSTQQVPVHYTELEQVNPVQQFFTLGAFGGGVRVSRTRWETVTDTTIVPVQKTRVVPRRVLQPVTRRRTREIEVPLEPKDFLSEARDQILTERREEMLNRRRGLL